MVSNAQFWLAISLALLPAQLAAQPYFNLDFETATRGQPWVWSEGGSGYEFVLDTSIKVSGAQSLRIRYVNAATFGSSASQYFPLADGKGHHLHFSGFIKTDSITQGTAGLWLRVDGATQMISLDNAPNFGLSGTNDWQSYSIDRGVSPDAADIIFGVFQFGNGTAWFDNFSVSLDGAPYPQGPPPYIGEPTSVQLD